MKRERRRVVLAVVGVTAVLVVMLGVQPVSVESILAGYVLALAAVALASLTRILGSDADHRQASAFESAIAPRPDTPTRPPELVRVEREITLGTTSAGHLHRRLLPLLRDAAVARVGTRGFTRERLGDDAWELLRPDRPEPAERTAPGISLRRLNDVVTTLEQL